jgi:hypothetical protein
VVIEALEKNALTGSVPDPDPNPDPDPPDSLVFGPPGSESGSISQRYGFGSGSGSGSGQKAKIVRKTLIPTVLWLILDFLSLKNDINVPGSGSTPKCHWSGTLLTRGLIRALWKERIESVNGRLKKHACIYEYCADGKPKKIIPKKLS